MTHDALPIPDYDHLPQGTLEARIRSLDADALRRLLDHERSHGDRLPVVQLLQRRLEAVEDGAELTTGSPDAPTPEMPGPPAGGSKASPETTGPPMNPPSQGVPTNPAQPRG